MSFAEHRGMCVLGHQYREFTFAYRVEGLRRIVVEAYVLLCVELTARILKQAAFAPAELLGPACDYLYVDIFVVNFESGGAARTQVEFRYVDEDVVAVYRVATGGE